LTQLGTIADRVCRHPTRMGWLNGEDESVFLAEAASRDDGLELNGFAVTVEYQPDPELRDHQQIPLLEAGGIEAFIRRKVLPYTPDALIVEADTKIGQEISFTRHFYRQPVLRLLAEISADIRVLEQEIEGLLAEMVGTAS
jgi:type I restriction enzyme M protein